MSPETPHPADPFGLNEAQRRAAYDLDHHIVLGSGAGCGKTRVLIARVVAALRQGVGVGEIAALTFTEKAAGEMITRLRAACRGQMAGSTAPDERRLWRSRLRDLERARISTIHAFCARLLREDAAEAGVDPRFGVLEELPASMLRNEAVAAVTATALEADEGVARLAAGQFGLDGMRDILDDLLRRRAAVRRAVGEKGSPTPDDLLARWRQAVFDWPVLHEHRRALRALQPHDETDRRAVQRSRALGLLGEAENEEDPALALGILHELAAGVNLRGGSDRNWPSNEAFKSTGAILKQLRDTFDGLSEDRQENARAERRAAEVLAALLQLLERCERSYAEAKASTGALDFADLQILARDLLRDNADVRERVRSSIRHVLVDELQDTDFLQLEIIRLLVGEDGRAGPILFAVGDPKQSIYRFRGAEVEVFDALARMAAGWNPEGVQALDTSYRTHARGVAFVNGFFGRLFGEEAPEAPFEVRYESVASDVDREGPAPSVVSLLTDPEDGENAAAGRVREAERLAAAIAEMVGTERPLVADPGDNALREVAYRDVAALFRSFRDVGVYEQALEEAGVPFYTVSGRAFFGRQEVKDVLLALKAIDNVHDEVSLVGALRSPLVGLSDEALYRMRARAGSVSAALSKADELPALAPDDREALARAQTLFGELRAIKDRVPIAALVQRLLAETGYDAGSLTQFAGRRRLANLRRLVDLAAELEHAGTLSQVVQRLDELVTTEQQGVEGAVVEEAENVVRLMTVHAAKGLEFPVVIIPDLGRQAGGRTPRVLIDPTAGPACKARTADGEAFTPAAQVFARSENKDRELAEEKRSLYVAMTRARDRIILSGVRPRPGKRGKWLDWFEACASGLDVTEAAPQTAAGGRRSRPGIDAVTEGGLVRWDRIADAIAGAPAAPPDLGRRLNPLPPPWTERRWFAAREIVEYQRCPRAYRLRSLEGVPDPLPTFGPAEGGPDGEPEDVPAPLCGRVAHAALERLTRDRDDPKVEEAVDFGLAQEAALPAAQVDRLRDWAAGVLRDFVRGPLFERLRTAAEVRTEMRFALRCASYNVDGRIDALWRDDAGAWHVVDYKTGDAPEDEEDRRIGSAGLQVQIYSLAVQELTGQPPVDATVYYLMHQEARAVPIDRAALQTARARIEQVVASVKAGKFPATQRGCEWCAYRGLCPAT